jgi:hypothetical protein
MSWRCRANLRLGGPYSSVAPHPLHTAKPEAHTATSTARLSFPFHSLCYYLDRFQHL